jgi:hypothetical protein
VGKLKPNKKELQLPKQLAGFAILYKEAMPMPTLF